VLLASRCLAAALSAILLSLVFGGPASAAAPSSMLAGETLTGSALPPSGLPLGANGQCSLGRNRTHFTFTGTASGPYSGKFTEAGHITYTLVLNNFDFFPEGGVVMHFSGRFSIHSPSGSVTGSQTLDRTVSSGVTCDESPGGTSLVTAICETLNGGVPNCTDAPVATKYVARATTRSRKHVDKGASMVTLFAGVDENPAPPLVGDSGISVSFS
jgi:hypothetical protein